MEERRRPAYRVASYDARMSGSVYAGGVGGKYGVAVVDAAILSKKADEALDWERGQVVN